MGFIIKNRTYYNSLGQIVEKEIFENEYNTFIEKLDEEYHKQLNELISIIPFDLSQEEKMIFIFSWLVNNINYEHNLDYNNDGSVTCPIIEIYNKGDHEKLDIRGAKKVGLHTIIVQSASDNCDTSSVADLVIDRVEDIDSLILRTFDIESNENQL